MSRKKIWETFPSLGIYSICLSLETESYAEIFIKIYQINSQSVVKTWKTIWHLSLICHDIISIMMILFNDIDTISISLMDSEVMIAIWNCPVSQPHFGFKTCEHIKIPTHPARGITATHSKAKSGVDGLDCILLWKDPRKTSSAIW